MSKFFLGQKLQFLFLLMLFTFFAGAFGFIISPVSVSKTNICPANALCLDNFSKSHKERWGGGRYLVNKSDAVVFNDYNKEAYFTSDNGYRYFFNKQQAQQRAIVASLFALVAYVAVIVTTRIYKTNMFFALLIATLVVGATILGVIFWENVWWQNL